jgi:hypothetical protein
MCAPGASRRRAVVFVGCRYDQAIRQRAPGCLPVSIVLRPVFSLFPPVLAPAVFLSFA